MRRLERALVVGGAGFYGSWLVEALLANGVETAVVDQRDRPELVAGAELLVADATTLDLAGLIGDLRIDAVFQLAGTGLVPLSVTDPLADLERNVRTTLSVLEAARSVGRPPVVCLVSSAAVYGEAQQMPMDENHPLEPLSPYGISKLAAEKYVSLYATLHGLPTFSVRPFSLYGPRQRKLVVYDLLARIVSGEDPLVVRASATTSRDFVFVEDAAHALVTLARNAEAKGEAYNIASGRAQSIVGLAEQLVAAVGGANVVTYDDVDRGGDPLHWQGDATRARSLGATFDTPLSHGLQRTVDWYLETTASQLAAATGDGSP
jgi:UDP-glucose 4-epimerase